LQTSLHMGIRCYHEGLAQCKDIADLKKLAVDGKITGNSDSGMLLFPDKMIEMFPNAKVILLRRPRYEVLKSLSKIFPNNPDECLKTMKMCETSSKWIVNNVDNLLMSDFSSLENENECKGIWNFINPDETFCIRRWKMLSNFNVQLHTIEYNSDIMATMMKNKMEVA